MTLLHFHTMASSFLIIIFICLKVYLANTTRKQIFIGENYHLQINFVLINYALETMFLWFRIWKNAELFNLRDK